MMRQSFYLLLPLSCGLCLSACAPVPGDSIAASDQARQCFFTRSINGYGDAPDGPGGEQRLYIETGVDDNWLFETFGSCHDLDFAEQIGLDTRGRSSVCTGSSETLIVPTPTGTRRCSVRLIGLLSDEQREAAQLAAEAQEAGGQGAN